MRPLPSLQSFKALALCILLNFCWLNIEAQSFKLGPVELYNTSYQDSVHSLSSIEDLKLEQGEKAFIKSQIGAEAPGQFLQLILSNSQWEDLSLLLRFCRLAAKIEVFDFSNPHPLHHKVVPAEANSLAPVPSSHHYFPISLMAKGEKHLVIYISFDAANQDPHYEELVISEATPIIESYFQKTQIQALYTGLVLLISILAMAAAYLLPYRALFYFAIHMLFWIPYFKFQNNLPSLLGDLFPFLDHFQVSNLVLFFLILSAMLFVVDYLKLKQQPNLYRAFLIIHLIGLGLLLFPIFDIILLWINYALALIVLLNLFFTAYFARRGSQAAKRLLYSFLVLLLGALLMTLTQIGLIPFFELTPYFFQIGTILFSLILFFALAAEVNNIREERFKAQQLVEIKSRFFEDISHELRSPLSLVVDPIKKVWRDLPEGNQKEALQIAKKAGEGLQSLVNQILDLSRMEFHPPQLKASVQDLNAFLKFQCSQFRSLADEKSIKLQYHAPNKVVACNFDPEKMQQVIGNLLSNALKFTPPEGEVSLELKELNDGFIQIEVSDNGPGISAKALPYIFDRFYQDPETPRQAQAGTGIGLALSKSLVELHQGQIKVESQKSIGSRFKILLSAADPAELDENKSNKDTEVNAAIARESLSQASKACILVAEDHPDLREYLKQCLQDHYQVLLCKDGQEAWDTGREQMPDLIVSDLMMPGLSGKELTEKLKVHPQTSHIPLILLTAKADKEAVKAGLIAGANDYLAKPFDSEELLLRIANILRQRAQWQKKLANSNLAPSEEVSLTKTDRDFLHKLKDSLAQKFTDPNFGVEDLAAEVSMSKTHLNRKLKALIDESANKTIQNYRLEAAYKMLRAKEGNVSEIAFSTGFNSAAYFVKCFKEKFGETPGQIL